MSDSDRFPFVHSGFTPNVANHGSQEEPAADLARKSSYFFSIGLVIALSLVIAAFEWESHPRLSIPGDPGTQQEPTIIKPITDVCQTAGSQSGCQSQTG